MQVYVNKALPLTPSPGEVGRRIVRHGMADVLDWLGEPVGPRPEDTTHAIVGFDPSRPGLTQALFVSPEKYALLREEAAR